MDLSTPPSSHGPSHTVTHSREGDPWPPVVSHVTGRHQVDHTGRTNTGAASGILAGDAVQDLHNRSHGELCEACGNLIAATNLNVVRWMHPLCSPLGYERDVCTC